MAGRLLVVLGDQLTRGIASLRDCDPAHDVILLAEVMEEATYVRHHPKKIAFLFSAMRHFAVELRQAGMVVDYVRLDDAGNRGSLRAEIIRAAAEQEVDGIVATHPGEYRVLADMREWGAAAGVPVDIRADDRFVCDLDTFGRWAEGRSKLLLEHFYREMRRRTGLLMAGRNEPEGGQWNFDADNRRKLPRGTRPPPAFRVAPDAITREVLTLVADRFGGHFGTLDDFHFAVTRADALAAFEHFLAYGLADFGAYQDAMKQGEPYLFHAVVSPYLNAGLLDPLECCRAVERAYRAGRVPLNSAEGWIRQVIGWREYVRGVYWLHMPDYAARNHLDAKRALPPFFWSGDTDMNCIAQVVGETRANAYAHHIQRLMVTGNFALLAGLDPVQVNEWYLVVYADAYEWVELPNVTGMILYADGGLLASKPYAASGKYIDRMSDYCRFCRYDVRQATGADACPFNYLYWDFLARNRDLLHGNERLFYPYLTLDRMDPMKLEQIRHDARTFLATIDALPPWLP